MAKQAFALMKRHHLEPIGAEIPLISHQMHLATRLDMVCRDTKTEGEVIISVKTGGPKSWIVNKKFNAPFDDIPCVPHNIDQLQVCICSGSS